MSGNVVVPVDWAFRRSDRGNPATTVPGKPQDSVHILTRCKFAPQGSVIAIVSRARRAAGADTGVEGQSQGAGALRQFQEELLIAQLQLREARLEPLVVRTV